jgi:DNA-binding NarL/FixJ family response regulator
VLAAGAAALVLKEAPLGDVVRALEAVLAGRSYLDPALGGMGTRQSKLTQRELAVLELLSEGLQHEEIGRRLGAATRTQAVATALRLGLIA